MTTATSTDSVTLQTISQIGETAGLIWLTLRTDGPMSLSRLVKQVGLPRDLVMQAIGWLAREDKLAFSEHGRNQLIRLREND
ncbi:MAG: winged helix-turn-helix domain-containing protein [Blastopirellula sp. JB062]